MTGVSLYILAEQFAALLDQVDPETGELPEGLGDARRLVKDKAAAVAAFIATRELNLEAVKARVKQVNEQIHHSERRIEHLRRYLLESMQRTGITEISSSSDPLLTVKRYPERDESVEVFDEAQLLPMFLTYPPPPAPKPDKAAIKSAIKAGKDVAGARIVKRDRLVIK